MRDTSAAAAFGNKNGSILEAAAAEGAFCGEEKEREETEEINKLENETESETADGPSDCCGFWKCRPLLTFRGRSAGL